MRKLDDATYNLITNPTLLEINFYSSNNKEVCRIITSKLISLFPNLKTSVIKLYLFLYLQFPYISATKVSRHKHKSHPHLPTGNNISTKHAFGLTSCKEPKANTWSIVDKNRGQICWNQYSSEKLEKPFCLYNRKALLTSYGSLFNLLFPLHSF